MTGRFLNGRVTLHAGDCLAVLPTLDENSIDSCVCDPPYHLASIVKRFGKPDSAEAQFGSDGAYRRASAGFMGKVWDGGDIAFRPETWAAVLRVLKPGAHLVAFAAPKNAHRMFCAIEDGGFEIRDTIAWLFGSGFPKSHNVSNGIDRIAGAERTKVPRQRVDGKPTGFEGATFNASDVSLTSGPAVTDTARQWQGWGTALKPAYEPICLARKPLSESTIAANVLRHGVGAINIDACRVDCAAGDKGEWPVTDRKIQRGLMNSGMPLKHQETDQLKGRWPANVILEDSDEVVEAFPDTASRQDISIKGESSAERDGNRGPAYGRESRGAGSIMTSYGDEGSAARFFYQVKREDRCSLCDVLIVEAPSKIGSTQSGAIAPCDAPGSQLLASADKRRQSKPNAKRAESVSSECHQPSAGFVPKNVEQWPLERIVQSVLSAADLCSSCATAIAQKLAEVRRKGRADKSPISLSIAGFKQTILIQSLASYVEHRESTDTILTTTSLRELFGSVFHAIGDYTNSVKSEANTRSAPCRFWYSSKADSDDRIGSKHPTVKPLDLMQYLVRLVTPPKGVVLDCFAGTGTTAEAAWREGFNAVLIEREPEYLADIERRMSLCLAGPDERARESIKARLKGKPQDHGPLFDERQPSLLDEAAA